MNFLFFRKKCSPDCHYYYNRDWDGDNHGGTICLNSEKKFNEDLKIRGKKEHIRYLMNFIVDTRAIGSTIKEPKRCKYFEDRFPRI